MTTLAPLVASATEVAVSVTVAGLGTVAGAVYVTDVFATLLSVPQVEGLHDAPRDQTTPALLESPYTVAVKFWVALFVTFRGPAGEIETETGTRCTVALSDLLGSACDVVVTITSAPDEIEEGAVYNPAELRVPHAPREHVERLQVTNVFVCPVTVAAN
jgi:hypothetical protein